MKRRYRVILPLELGGRTLEYGDVVELETSGAIEYAEALIALEDESGGNS